MDPLISLTIALAFATLFGGSAVHQILGWHEWPGVVRNYRLVPETLAPVVAVAVPILEAVTAAALLWSSSRALGAMGAAGLLVVFARALWINIRRGRTQIDCGCFGSRLRSGLSRGMVLRNLLLAALALSLLLPVTPRTLPLFELAVSLTIVATLAFLYPVLSLLLESRPPPEGRAGLPIVRSFAVTRDIR